MQIQWDNMRSMHITITKRLCSFTRSTSPRHVYKCLPPQLLPIWPIEGHEIIHEKNPKKIQWIVNVSVDFKVFEKLKENAGRSSIYIYYVCVCAMRVYVCTSLSSATYIVSLFFPHTLNCSGFSRFCIYFNLLCTLQKKGLLHRALVRCFCFGSATSHH